MLRKTFFYLFFCLIGTFFAQSQAGESAEQDMIYRYHWAIGGGVHTQGVNFNTFFIKKIDFLNGIVASIDFGWMNDFKEIYTLKISSKYADPFVFGKKNFMFFNRFSAGGWRVLFEKYRVKGIQIDLRYEFGLSLAYLKPVFLKVIDTQNHHEDVVEMYDENKHPYSSIIGGASGFLGIPYTKVKFGLHAKPALHFDWFKSKRKYIIGAFEIGAIIDVYPQGVEIMAYQKKNYFFITGYFVLFFGKKFI